MDQEIFDYLKGQRVGVLAVEMPDGSSHAATVHFAHTENPFVFYFETSKDYRKSEALLGKETSRASFVIGSSESDMKTLQMDGTVRILTENELEPYDAVYLAKFSEKKKHSDDPKFVFFTFIPKWWRYTDWTKPEGKFILSSEK